MSYWSGMSKVARSLEMQRRRTIAAKKRKHAAKLNNVINHNVPTLLKRDKLIIALTQNNMDTTIIAQILHLYDSAE